MLSGHTRTFVSDVSTRLRPAAVSGLPQRKAVETLLFLSAIWFPGRAGYVCVIVALGLDTVKIWHGHVPVVAGRRSNWSLHSASE